MTKIFSKWKYKTTRLIVNNWQSGKGQDSEEIMHLNEMGDEGWELVSKEKIENDAHDKIGNYYFKYVFKKPKN